MNDKNKTECTVTPAEGLFLAAESAELAFRHIVKALELVGDHVLELRGPDDEDAEALVYSVLCLAQESARHCAKELTAARQAYQGLPH